MPVFALTTTDVYSQGGVSCLHELKHFHCLRKSERLNKKQAKCVGRAEKQSPGADTSGMLLLPLSVWGKEHLEEENVKENAEYTIYTNIYTHTYIHHLQPLNKGF